MKKPPTRSAVSSFSFPLFIGAVLLIGQLFGRISLALMLLILLGFLLRIVQLLHKLVRIFHRSILLVESRCYFIHLNGKTCMYRIAAEA